MADNKYGVIISQQGIDINYAADYQKVLDSRWRSMEIDEEIMIDQVILIKKQLVNTRVPLHKIHGHSVGHLAAFETQLQSDTSVISGNPNSISIIRFLSDDENIYIDPNSFSNYDVDTTIRLRVFIRIFTLNILEEFTSPVEPFVSASPAAMSRYGARFLDKQRNSGRIDDPNFSSFTMNTDGKQISVHSQGTIRVLESDLEAFKVEHGLPYAPSFLLCELLMPDNPRTDSPDYIKTYASNLVSTYFRASNRDGVLRFGGIQSIVLGDFGYVILKDPMELIG